MLFFKVPTLGAEIYCISDYLISEHDTEMRGEEKKGFLRHPNLKIRKVV